MVGQHHYSMGMSVSELWEMVMDREGSPWGRKESEQLNNHSSRHFVREAPAVLLLGVLFSLFYQWGSEKRTCPGV